MVVAVIISFVRLCDRFAAINERIRRRKVIELLRVGSSGWGITNNSRRHVFTLVRKLRGLILLRWTASARTMEVAAERIGTALYSGGKAKAGGWVFIA